MRVPGWPQRTTQAGDALRDLLSRMGAAVSLDASGLTVTGTGPVLGIDADLHDVGELTPAVAALCALAETPSRLRGIAHIRGHETDRIAALATELRSLGADVTEHDDGLTLEPASLHGGTFHTYADHRMAHAAVVVGLRGGGGPRRGRRHDRQDLPGLRRGLGRAGAVTGRYDEHDPESYERPRRHTRPRTKDRPTYDDAVACRGGDRRPRPLHLRPRSGRPARDGDEVAARWAARGWWSATGCASSGTPRASTAPWPGS